MAMLTFLLFFLVLFLLAVLFHRLVLARVLFLVFLFSFGALGRRPW